MGRPNCVNFPPSKNPISYALLISLLPIPRVLGPIRQHFIRADLGNAGAPFKYKQPSDYLLYFRM